MASQVTGIVIREIDFGDSNKILVLLTAEKGKISVFANGVKKYKSQNMNSTQLFCYSQMIIYESKDKYWLKESALIENFYDIRLDLEKLALSQYFLDIVNDVCVENESGVDDDSEIMLKLLLNSLYMVLKKEKPFMLIKGVFELCTAAYIGFLPDLICCSDCGAYESDLMYFNVMDAHLICDECFKRYSLPENHGDENEKIYDSYNTALIIKLIYPPVLKSMRHIIYGKPSRIFAFKLSDDMLVSFGDICESYLLNHIERGFKTLRFYKDIIGNGGKDK
jgi:DNA repair protein RecO (recombination protein O)